MFNVDSVPDIYILCIRYSNMHVALVYFTDLRMSTQAKVETPKHHRIHQEFLLTATNHQLEV